MPDGRRPIDSIGIGIPGQVEPGTARVVHAVNLGVDELDLAAAVEPALGVPVRVENDVKAAAFGAYALHGGSGSMALPQPRHRHRRRDRRGRRAVARRARHRRRGRAHLGRPERPALPLRSARLHRGASPAAAPSPSAGARPGALPVRDVFDAADDGDPSPASCARASRAVSPRRVRVLVLTADVDVVVLGGGVTALGDRLMADVAAELAASAEASPFMRSLRLEERVELLPAGSPAAALGAALVGAARDPEDGARPWLRSSSSRMPPPPAPSSPTRSPG